MTEVETKCTAPSPLCLVISHRITSARNTEGAVSNICHESSPFGSRTSASVGRVRTRRRRRRSASTATDQRSPSGERETRMTSPRRSAANKSAITSRTAADCSHLFHGGGTVGDTSTHRATRSASQMGNRSEESDRSKCHRRQREKPLRTGLSLIY